MQNQETQQRMCEQQNTHKPQSEVKKNTINDLRRSYISQKLWIKVASSPVSITVHCGAELT